MDPCPLASWSCVKNFQACKGFKSNWNLMSVMQAHIFWNLITVFQMPRQLIESRHFTKSLGISRNAWFCLLPTTYTCSERSFFFSWLDKLCSLTCCGLFWEVSSELDPLIFGDPTPKKVLTRHQDLSGIVPDFAYKTFFGVGSLDIQFSLFGLENISKCLNNKNNNSTCTRE